MSDFVNITVDGKEIQVPKGMNLIEAAREAGVEIPHYCYHKDLSVAGNCRMCQVQVEGQRKLTIACNTGATDGMVVQTQESSKEVADAQRATLEFLLINHPLDCTVCDQAGHCKLQDYYFEYNGQPSRFLEEKVSQVKAEPLGPEIIYDGERCIMCTRCVRFCDEVTGSGELGVLNRGDKSVIAVHPDQELDNPLAGCVVDLCPVGALTHRRWRFNTRIWYTESKSTVCPGCSTGCNAEVFTRDGEIVQVKGRYNEAVNKEWLCDEGRYGLGSYQDRVAKPEQNQTEGQTEEIADVNEAIVKVLDELQSSHSLAVFLSPFLTLEEFWSAKSLLYSIAPRNVQLAVQCRVRELTAEEAVLISPDRAPNIRSAELLGLLPENTAASWRLQREQEYEALLEGLENGNFETALFLGPDAILESDLSETLVSKIGSLKASICLSPGGTLASLASLYLPGLTVVEQEGLYLNSQGRLQRIRQLLTPPEETLRVFDLHRVHAAAKGDAGLEEDHPGLKATPRTLSRYVLRQLPSSENLGLSSIKLKDVGEQGIDLFSEEDGSQSASVDLSSAD